MKSESMLTPREKSPLPVAQMRVEPMTLHDTEQQVQHTMDWTIPAHYTSNLNIATLVAILPGT